MTSLAQAGIITGYKDANSVLTGQFGPANPVTEAEILKMALLAAGKTIGDGIPQNALAKDDWSAPYVKTAEDLRLTLYVPTLDVRQPATRGEVVETILEVFGVPTDTRTDNPFSDMPIDHPHAAAILTAWRLGIITGDTDEQGTPVGIVRPDDLVNRAEAAKILALVLQLRLNATSPQAPSAAQSSSSESAAGALYRVTSPSLNVRADSRINAAVLDVLHTGDEFTVLNIVDVWAQVRLGNGEEGFVAVKYLAKV